MRLTTSARSTTIRSPTNELILASQSPRRRQILESLGLSFRTLSPVGDEIEPTASSLRKDIAANASMKARSCLKQVPGFTGVILAADTLVVLDEQVLGKPTDEADARRMLKLLSGREHAVLTGMVLLKEATERVSITESRVRFRSITPAELDAYVASAEPYDKAGAYAVQGLSSLFIDEIKGSYSNVMGLPIETLLTELPVISQRSIFDWFARRG